MAELRGVVARVQEEPDARPDVPPGLCGTSVKGMDTNQSSRHYRQKYFCASLQAEGV